MTLYKQNEASPTKRKWILYTHFFARIYTHTNGQNEIQRIRSEIEIEKLTGEVIASAGELYRGIRWGARGWKYPTLPLCLLCQSASAPIKAMFKFPKLFWKSTVILFVCIWQTLSNHGLTRLKTFVSTFTDKLYNYLFFYLHLMFHTCAGICNVTENLKNCLHFGVN
jgi:hypothetical protein